jgi:hypothetical protein
LETDSIQVLRRKDEKNFEKRVKRLEIVEKEAIKEKLFPRKMQIELSFGDQDIQKSLCFKMKIKWLFLGERQDEVGL